MNRRFWLAAIPAGTLLGQNAMQKKREVRIHNPAGLAAPVGYSHVAEVSAGKTVYIAGQVAMDKAGQLVGVGDFAAQVRQVFENLSAALAGTGATFGDVVKLNIFCDERIERSQLPALSETRDRYVNVKNPPVSTLVFVKGLARPEWLLEIEATAIVAI